MRVYYGIVMAVCLGSLFDGSPLQADEPLTRSQAGEALRRAVAFFREKVSANGGYVWRYRHDLSAREGERRASSTTAWVQPPGTPTVGMALLEAYRMTGEESCLQAAREAADALVRGQLQSGGWDYRIEFAPEDRKRYAYRVEPSDPNGRNVTTLDDNTTQSALRFLMQLDQALAFQEETIHDAVEYGLNSLLKAQYPNGAWPQRYDRFPNPDDYPIKRAGYPEAWSRTYPKDRYGGLYTFNDHAIADTIGVMLTAARLYGQEQYGVSARKGGDSICLAQMPDPQPAWAQQYNREMHPAWARKFEPPAITGGESQSILRTLLHLYRETGETKYLEPVPRALAYLKNSQLPDGRLARFYELKTNKPLYFNRQYELTYRDEDLPTHYSFLVDSKLEAIEAAYKRVLRLPPSELQRPAPNIAGKRRLTSALAKRAQAVVDQMDQRGAWVTPGRLRSDPPGESAATVIETRTFVRNLRTLSELLAAIR